MKHPVFHLEPLLPSPLLLLLPDVLVGDAGDTGEKETWCQRPFLSPFPTAAAAAATGWCGRRRPLHVIRCTAETDSNTRLPIFYCACLIIGRAQYLAVEHNHSCPNLFDVLISLIFFFFSFLVPVASRPHPHLSAMGKCSSKKPSSISSSAGGSWERKRQRGGLPPAPFSTRSRENDAHSLLQQNF